MEQATNSESVKLECCLEGIEGYMKHFRGRCSSPNHRISRRGSPDTVKALAVNETKTRKKRGREREESDQPWVRLIQKQEELLFQRDRYPNTITGQTRKKRGREREESVQLTQKQEEPLFKRDRYPNTITGQSAIQAVQGGAHRMELCANLSQGGVTPSIGDIEEAVSAAKGSGTAVHVLIRPRPGDFVYSQREKKVMAKDVAAALKAGAHGVVIGALLEKGGIDKEITAELIRVARATAAPCSCSITFHRAFDCCATEATAALETLMRLGVDRVLTSGRAESAWAGRDTITRLVEAGQGRIVVIPGAGISRTNVKQLLIHTGAKEVHVGSGCHENIPWGSPRQSSVSLGPSEGPSAVIRRVSRRLVSEILNTLA